MLLTAAIAAGRARGTLSEAEEEKLAHGLIELPEDATRVEPGAIVGFLSYSALAE